jgi:hypothetical protein
MHPVAEVSGFVYRGSNGFTEYHGIFRELVEEALKYREVKLGEALEKAAKVLTERKLTAVKQVTELGSKNKEFEKLGKVCLQAYSQVPRALEFAKKHFSKYLHEPLKDLLPNPGDEC